MSNYGFKKEKIYEERQNYFRNWLAEWEFYNINSYNHEEEEIEGTGDSYEKIKEMIKCDDVYKADVYKGEIVLLSSSFSKQETPHYAIIASEINKDGEVILIPFSYFVNPAVSGEIKSKREAINLEVMQVWNARIIHHSLLKEGAWHVDEDINSAEEGLNVFKHITLGDEKINEELLKRTGPPVFVEDDPRLEYQQIASELLKPLERRLEEFNENR